MKRRHVGLLSAFALFLALPVGATGSPANQQDSIAAANWAKEAAARDLQTLADASGALGMYVDPKTGDYIVVFSEAAGPQLDRARAAATGLTVRVETRAIDAPTIQQIGGALLALHPALAKQAFSYGFGFDPQSGAVQLDSDAPESMFSDVLAKYPGLVTFRHATFETTSWDNDSPPHFGGAWLQSSTNLCTSGWSMEDNNNHRWMVTAGHCFPNGTTTNMGTSIRDDAYSNWGIDVARITGHSYAGEIYADGANGVRAVKDGNDPVVGSSYCTTGRTSGFVCGWTDLANNRTICFPGDPCFNHLAAFSRSNGVPVQQGDSGGPFFIKDGSLGVGVRGIISGRSVVDPQWPGTWISYAQQYHSIADFYVSHAVTQ